MLKDQLQIDVESAAAYSFDILNEAIVRFKAEEIPKECRYWRLVIEELFLNKEFDELLWFLTEKKFIVEVWKLQRDLPSNLHMNKPTCLLDLRSKSMRERENTEHRAIIGIG